MKIKFLLSALSTLPLPAMFAVKKAAKLGFDGVEILSNGWNRTKFSKYIEYAKSHNMVIHAHQPWSANESNAPSLQFKILEAARFMPHDRCALEECLPPEDIPKIVYAGQIEAARNHPNYWLQTCPVRRNGSNDISLAEFCSCWVWAPNICFDFQHFLEWRNGSTMTPANFASLTKGELLKQLIEGFDCFGQHVKEIHLTDSRPSLGLKGLNVPLGTGVLPLKEVCAHIVATGWSGFVVPEVTAQMGRLYPYKDEHLREILDTARSLFN